MKNLHLNIHLWTLLFTILAFQTLAQGWRREYSGSPASDDYCFTLLLTPDNGFLMDGSRQFKTDANGDLQWAQNTIPSYTYGNRKAVMLPDGSYATIRMADTSDNPVLTKYDAAGNALWSQEYPDVAQGAPFASSIDLTADGGFVFIVNEPDGNTSCECDQYHVLKTDSEGNLLWQATNNTTLDYNAASVIGLSDGGIAVAGRHMNTGSFFDAYLEKRDSNGNQLWEIEWPLAGVQQFTTLTETADGHIVVAGNDKVIPDQPLLLMKTSLDGDVIWYQEFNDLIGRSPRDVRETIDGNIVVVGHDAEESNSFLLSVDADGNENWRRLFDDQLDALVSVQPCPDGSLAVGGYTPNGAWGNALLIKLDSLGNLYSHILFGKVFFDEALDCTLDGSETGLQNWIVTAAGEETFYGSTDTAGNFSILVDTGAYLLNVSLPANNWLLCQPGYPVQAAAVYDSTQVDIPVQPGAYCPLMEVSLATPVIRPCFPSFYNINYCNLGTEAAFGATIQLDLAPALEFTSTTGNLLSQNGQQLIFGLGDVGVNQCGAFSVFFLTECDSTLVGETLCSEARIFPDSTCAENYTGPIIEVSGQCEGDSVKFEIQNSGEAMPDWHEYIIIEDNIILMQGDFQLGQGEFIQTAIAAASGATYHLLAAQSPGYPPILGNHVASFSIEGCVGPPNPGAFNELLLGDGEPWLDIECREAIAAYDPNDKTPAPTGWTAQHLIDDRTELEYRIRFQNTGNDTAFTVVLADTLSSLLDPASIRPGASSHPYAFELSGQGIARFTFPNIMLPDSATNEAASQGFVQFRIAQKPGNPVGAVIENTAHIYFDFNAPIATNTTWHTIGEPWVSVVSGTAETFRPGLSVAVFPNPLESFATFRLQGYAGNGWLDLYDAQGRLALRQAFAAGEARVQRNDLPAGLYFFSMTGAEGLLATGKVVVR
ncbi:MAG: T9SS type A sorting domain-containing protein [Saprospiraceae bacterium]